MTPDDVAGLVTELTSLLRTRYVDPAAADQIATVLAQRQGADGYPVSERDLADAVTADLQSVNGDLHLRLRYHDEPLPERQPDDDSEEYAAMTRWAAQTGGGIARVERLPPNIGYLDLQPVIFPAVISGAAITAAMTLIASADALILDLRHCLGGEPATTVFVYSYLCGHEPAELTGLYERTEDRIRQQWTLPYVPGERFGPDKPVYALTSGVTFSGGEQLAYDLQQQGRATLIGQRTRGGAHAREGFRLHPHLEATISVARAVSPIDGANWEGHGITPDIVTPEGEELDRALSLISTTAPSPIGG
jgi:hypothetical protein